MQEVERSRSQSRETGLGHVRSGRPWAQLYFYLYCLAYIRGLSPITLLSKDYFTEKEAAHYCCVSLTQFRKEKVKYGIIPGKFMGKKVYRRADLQRAIEGEFMSLVSPK
jgi:hypothetical protein